MDAVLQQARQWSWYCDWSTVFCTSVNVASLCKQDGSLVAMSQPPSWLSLQVFLAMGFNSSGHRTYHRVRVMVREWESQSLAKLYERLVKFLNSYINGWASQSLFSISVMLPFTTVICPYVAVNKLISELPYAWQVSHFYTELAGFTF